MVPPFLLMPEPNHTSVQRHLTLCPHMLHTAHQGNALRGPGGMAFPPVCHCGYLYSLLCCEHVRFERHDDIDPALTLQVGHHRPCKKATIFEQQITRA